jgi:hypothetical protein
MAKPRVVIRWKTKYRPAPLSPLKDQAATLAAGIIDPQVAELKRQAAERELAGQKQQTAAQGTAAALAAIQAGVPRAVQDTYAQAANQQASFAQGPTGTVGDLTQKAASEAAAKIASMEAPGQITSQGAAQAQAANYAGGYLPASDLAAQAAARATEQYGYNTASQAALSQQALQQLQASTDEVSALRAKGVDIENTRPAEVQKALLTLREQQRADRELAMQQRASAAQIHQLNTAQARALESDAYNRSQLTGTLWTVKNGRLVNTGRTAAGSSAYQNVASNTLKQQDLLYQQQQDAISNSFKKAGLKIDQQRANAYAARQQKMNTGGFSQATIAKWKAKAAANAAESFRGVPNPNYVKGAKADDPNYLKIKDQWIRPPRSAAAVLRDLTAEMPYSVAYTAIRAYAKAPNSRWAGALKWQKTWPPKPQKKK